MRDEVVPRRQLPVEVLGIGVRECAEMQVPLIGIVSIEVKIRKRLRRLQLIRILKSVAQSKSSVVMKVITKKHVGGSCQFADCFQGRMRFDDRHYHQPAWIRRAKHSDATIVVRDVLGQPINRVVCVGTFVDRIWIARAARRTLHHKLPFGLKLTANILKGKDESFLN